MPNEIVWILPPGSEIRAAVGRWGGPGEGGPGEGGGPLAGWRRHFPARDLAALPAHRQEEHQAVVAVLDALLPPGWQVDHDAQGRPSLVPSAWEAGQVPAPLPHLSLSHARQGADLWAAAALAPFPVGIDLETPRPQLRRIAPRIFSTSERARLPAAPDDLETLCLLWCIKEALWKALGPELRFIDEIEVQGLDAPLSQLAAGASLPVRVRNQTLTCWVARLEMGWVALGPLHPLP
jgi:hypothetical protein